MKKVEQLYTLLKELIKFQKIKKYGSAIGANEIEQPILQKTKTAYFRLLRALRPFYIVQVFSA